MGPRENFVASFKMKDPQSTFLQDYPNNYKFTGINLNYSYNLNLIERQTYGLLEFFGDLGGLTDALIFLGGLFVGPFIEFEMQRRILESTFMMKPTQTKNQIIKDNMLVEHAPSPRAKVVQQIKTRLRLIRPALKLSFLEFFVKNSLEAQRKRRMIKLSNVKFAKELDLFKFIQR